MMPDPPDNLEFDDQEPPRLDSSDPVLAAKVKAIIEKRARDREDPGYNVLNVAVWHAHAGDLSNRITDLEAYFGPLTELLNSLRATARKSDNAADLINVLEKVEAYNEDAAQYIHALRQVSDAMDKELEWYTNEIFEFSIRIDQGADPRQDDPDP